MHVGKDCERVPARPHAKSQVNSSPDPIASADRVHRASYVIRGEEEGCLVAARREPDRMAIGASEAFNTRSSRGLARQSPVAKGCGRVCVCRSQGRRGAAELGFYQPVPHLQRLTMLHFMFTYMHT